MNRKRTIFLWGILFLLGSSPSLLTAGEGDAGVESHFLLGAGARAHGMGRAFVALANDSSTLYWNPSGLSLLSQKELTALHTNLWEGTIYDFLGYVHPTRTLGSFGLGVIRIGTEEIKRRDNHNYPQGTFNYMESEYILSYGRETPSLSLFSRKIFPSLFGGVNLKLLDQRLDTYRATGIGLDLGLLNSIKIRRAQFPKLSLGINLQDLIGARLKLKEVPDQLPLNVKMGISLTHQFFPKLYGSLVFDLDKTETRSYKSHYGMEIFYSPLLAFRLGLDQNQLCAGLGISYRGFQIDYAWVSGEISNTHRFSLTTRFGRTKEEEILLAAQKKEREYRKRMEEEKKGEIAYHSSQADSFSQKGDYLLALGEWQKVLALDPLNPQAKAGIENAEEKIKTVQKENERKREEEALKEEHLALGMEYFRQGNLHAALNEWERLLKLDPDHILAKEYREKTRLSLEEELTKHRNAARTLEAQGRLTEALIEWKEVLRLNPNDETAQESSKRLSKTIFEAQHLNLGIKYFDNGQYSKASAEFELVLRSNPGHKSAQEYLRKCGQRPVLSDIAKNKELWKLYLQGVEEFSQGEYAKAIEYWEKVLKLDPQNENALRNIEEAKRRLEMTKNW